MINKLFFLLFGISFFSCRGHDVDIITLQITNRSHNLIDSIIIPYKKIKIKNVEVGETETVKIDVSDYNSYDEGIIPVYIYQNQRKFTGQFGLHDWAVFAKKEEHIYLFDKGINNKDEPLLKPTDFTLLIISKTLAGIDSVDLSPLVLRTKKISKSFTDLTLDFNLFEKEPLIKIYQKRKLYIIKVDHDWNNWNDNADVIYVYDNRFSQIVSDQ
jgi:hypothetical protein